MYCTWCCYKHLRGTCLWFWQDINRSVRRFWVLERVDARIDILSVYLSKHHCYKKLRGICLILGIAKKHWYKGSAFLLFIWWYQHRIEPRFWYWNLERSSCLRTLSLGFSCRSVAGHMVVSALYWAEFLILVLVDLSYIASIEQRLVCLWGETKMHTKSDSEVTSLAPSSPTRSPRRPVYYVQSPSRDSHDGEKMSFQSTPILSPMGSPPHSNSSLGRHSRESSTSRFSGSLKPGSRKVQPHDGRHGKGNKGWNQCSVIEEEGPYDEFDDEKSWPRRCYVFLFYLVFCSSFHNVFTHSVGCQ